MTGSPLSRPESVTSMANPKGAPKPFEASHASYPGPLGALPARLPATIWALRSSCSSGTPAGSMATTAGSAARALTSSALRSRNCVCTLGHRKVGGDLAPGVLRIPAGILTRRARHGLDRHAAAGRTALDLVGGAQRGGRAHRRVGPDQLGHAVEGGALGMDDVAVLGGVARGRSRRWRAASPATRPSPVPRTGRARAPHRGRARPCPPARAAPRGRPRRPPAAPRACRRGGWPRRRAGARRRRRSPPPARTRRSALPRARWTAPGRAARGPNPAPRAGARRCQGVAIRRPPGTRLLPDRRGRPPLRPDDEFG